MQTTKISDSVAITHFGTEVAGTIVVTIDGAYKFSYCYNPHNPCQSYEHLAIAAMSQC